jgi:hypothetical protein
LQLNLINKAFINKRKLKLRLILELLAKAANRSEMQIYRIITADVNILDSRGRKETYIVSFIVIDL